jgi:peptide/nickel transport system permease protein
VLRVVSRRLLITVPTLLGVVLVALLLVDLMPGDPATIMAGERATPEAVESIREDLGLDQPFVARFADYVGGVLRGDLGESPGSGTPVWDRIEEALPVTFSLGLVAMVLAVVGGVATGVAAALHQGRWIDQAVTGVSSVLLAVPSFVVGLALVIAFAVNRSILPASGYEPISSGLWPWLERLILPGAALALASGAELARQTRGALVDTMEQDFIRAHRAKGLGRWRVLAKHAAKNAATPVTTVAGLQITRMLGGAIVVERIFGMHGFGELAVNAVLTRDLVLIQGVVLVSAVVVLLVNLLVDLSHAYLNPQVRA